MKNLFLTKTRWLVTIILLTALGSGNAWGEEITYTFSSKSWTASPADWTSNTAGSSFESSGSARGVANNGVNGACTSPITFANVSSISIVASSNAKGGKVAIKIGDTQIANKEITNKNNITYTYDSDDYLSIANLSGNVQIVVTKNSKTVWVKSITITYSAAPAYTVGWTIDPAAGGSLSTTSGTSTTVTPNSAYTYGSPAYTVTTGSATVLQNTNTFTATPTSNCSIRINMVERPKFTVTLKDDGDKRTQASAGASVTLPSRDGCAGYTFAGWTKTWVAAQTEWTTTAPTIIPAGSYTPTANENLYPVYTKTEGGGGPTTESYGFEEESPTNWTIGSQPSRSNSNAHSGSYAGYINTNHTYVTFKEKVKVTAFSFWLKRTSTNSNYYVYIETSTNGTDWSAAATYKMSDFGNGTYTQKEMTWDGSTAYYVRFHCYNTTAARYVDDISITYSGGSTTYYISEANCCTPLGSINGSF